NTVNTLSERCRQSLHMRFLKHLTMTTRNHIDLQTSLCYLFPEADGIALFSRLPFRFWFLICLGGLRRITGGEVVDALLVRLMHIQMSKGGMGLDGAKTPPHLLKIEVCRDAVALFCQIKNISGSLFLRNLAKVFRQGDPEVDDHHTCEFFI